ncbi:MAG: glycosyltransferase family 4 protein [Eubacteriales bacterium]|nr:glycosyltransferase family 4 protein [Eubacteriales bacterium]
MNVLMVGNDLSVQGGITSVMTQLLEYNWEKQNIEMKYIPTYVEAGMLRKFVFFAKAYRRINQEIRQNKPDLVHIHMSYRGSFFRKYLIHKLCQKNRIPDVVHLHGSEFAQWYAASGHALQKRIQSMLRECSLCIVLGEKWNRTIKKIEPAATTMIVRNAVHIPHETVAWRIPFTILFLGALIPRKGVADLLQALQQIKGMHGLEHIRLVIAGTGAEEGALRARSAQLSIGPYVTFAGWVDGEAKKKLLRECQMLVLPSYHEGLPVAILEAMSYGMPIVATDVGDISAAVHEGENGFLVRPGDIDGLADRMYALASNQGLFDRMCRRSKAIVREFSDEAYGEQMVKAYVKGMTNI